jgi:hypothetical protein
MNNLLKISLVAFYVVAAICAFNPIFGDASKYFVYVALGLFVAHLCEIPVAYKWIKTYSGGLVLSIVLTLLYGFLHWMPLKKAAGA